MSKAIVYEVDGEKVKLTPSIVRSCLVGGGGNPSGGEITKFIMLCYYQKLNPFLGDAYLVKGKGDDAALIMVGKDVHVKRAQRHPEYKGIEQGVIVKKKDGEIEYRLGTFYDNSEELAGGWARVHRSDFQEPLWASVRLDEYLGRTRQGNLKSNWRKMPGTMIQKVAMSHALRLAFPQELRALYSKEEMDAASDEVDLSTLGDSELSDSPDVTAPDVTRPGTSKPEVQQGGVGKPPADKKLQVAESSSGLRQAREYRVQLGRTAPEEIGSCVFRTAMLFDNEKQNVVILGARKGHADEFKALPGGAFYKGEISPLKGKLLKRLSFSASLADYNDAEKYWILSKMKKEDAV